MDASPLARLSPELRNLIYTYTFTSTYAITMSPNAIQHALPQTCRQLRHETLGMSHALSRFNAHLDDGPATRLAHWLTAIGRKQCLLLNEVNVWDMHMLNATLHGEETTRKLLLGSTPPSRTSCLLLNRVDEEEWDLPEITVALQSMALDLARLCYKAPAGMEWTSHFAIVPQQSGARSSDVG